MKAWKVILAAVLIFGMGIATGALATQARLARARQRTPAQSAVPAAIEMRLDVMRRLARQLDLTVEQAGRVEAIVRDSRARMRGVFEQVQPQMRDELRRMRDELRGVLTPEQRRRFEELLRRSRTNRSPATDQRPRRGTAPQE